MCIWYTDDDVYMHYIQTENGSESDPHSYEAPTARITSTGQ